MSERVDCRSLARSVARGLAASLLVTALVTSPGHAAQPSRTQPAPAPHVEASAKPHRFAVAVFGDGFAQALRDGLQLNMTGQPDVAVLDETHPPFGLAQPERFDWTATIRDRLATPQPIDAAIVMLGANDTVAMQDGGHIVDPSSPRWAQLYGERVEAIAALFHAKNIALTWVGLPVIQDEKLSAGFAAQNEIVREHVGRFGATYVDSWDAFVDEAGKFAQSGPDLNGRIVKLRMEDGVDFTNAGERKLASFAEPDLRRARDQARVQAQAADAAQAASVAITDQPDFDNALQIDVNAQIRREAGLAALPPEQGGQAPAKTRNGPVIPITAPALSGDGKLADLSAASGPGAGDTTIVQRWLVEGQPIQPKRGRTDDFSWPKPQ